MPDNASKSSPQIEKITHDFMNALASVHSLSQILQQNPGLGLNLRKRFLDIILSETHRLISMIRHLPKNSADLKEISQYYSSESYGVDTDRLILCEKSLAQNHQSFEMEKSK